jgi:hypothetical protein
MTTLPARLKLTTFSFLLLFSVPGLTSAQSRTAIDVHSLGPQVGERVPEFRLPDQNGRIQTLESIMGPNGAMLLFHRSADW